MIKLIHRTFMMNNNDPVNYYKKLVVLIAVATTIRLVIASSVELSNAEVYYWTYSLKLKLNYFDHPPMVAWLIRLTTANLSIHREIFVRLGAIIASAICTLLVFRIGALINDLKTGWIAALLYTSSLYGSFITGSFILPDSPQMIFWLASLYVLIKISRATIYDKRLMFLWCTFGLLSGFCVMSKVHGSLLWFGVALYAFFVDRNWLKTPGLYIAMLISLIVISPIIIWNFQNNFASVKFHGSRILPEGPEIHVGAFTTELMEEIFLIVNPINFVIIISSIFWAAKLKSAIEKKLVNLLLFCSLPLIFGVMFISLFRETKAHWAGPAYTTLVILSAWRFTFFSQKIRIGIPTSIKCALAYTLIVAVSEVLITLYYPGNISQQKEGFNLGSGDLTLDMYGWQDAGKQFDSLFKSDVSRGIMKRDVPIVVNRWYPAAHLEYYFASRTNQQVIGIGDVLDLHEYYFTNAYKHKLKKGANAYFIVPSNLFDYKDLDKILANFKSFVMSLVISESRSGIVCKKFYVFRLENYQGH